jgi:hypothetical protein
MMIFGTNLFSCNEDPDLWKNEILANFPTFIKLDYDWLIDLLHCNLEPRHWLIDFTFIHFKWFTLIHQHRSIDWLIVAYIQLYSLIDWLIQLFIRQRLYNSDPTHISGRKVIYSGDNLPSQLLYHLYRCGHSSIEQSSPTLRLLLRVIDWLIDFVLLA